MKSLTWFSNCSIQQVRQKSWSVSLVSRKYSSDCQNNSPHALVVGTMTGERAVAFVPIHVCPVPMVKRVMFMFILELQNQEGHQTFFDL
jgi:hypothetical protein